jgi:hypothetical protein
MKNKYLVAGAVLGAAFLIGATALAQTDVSSGQNAAPTAISAAAPSADAASAGMVPDFSNRGQGNRMIGQRVENNVGNFSGRGMMNAVPFNKSNGSSRTSGVFSALRAIAGAVTMLLVWAIMALVIALLCFKVKQVKKAHREGSGESRK